MWAGCPTEEPITLRGAPVKRPAFQFYVGDWLRNAKLRRCSPAARGAWIDVLCLLHGSDEYGVLRWPLTDIAQAAGLPVKLLRELAEKGVLKGSDQQAIVYTYTPRHAGTEGDPVDLIVAGDGPCWYCSRFVRDEHIRKVRGGKTRFDSENQPQTRQPKATPNNPPNPRVGDGEGGGASSSSSTSVKQEPHTGRADLPDDGQPEAPPGSSFQMRLDWKPDPNCWALYAKRAGIVNADLTDEVLIEFTNHWHADGSFKTGAEWANKLVSQIKYRKDRGITHGARQRDAKPIGFEKGDAVSREWLESRRAAGTHGNA